MVAFQRKVLSLLIVLLSGILGCSEPKVPVSDLAQAKAIAEQVLEAWMSGSAMDDLKRMSPPIIVSEDLWRRQVALRSYKISGDGAMLGPNARFDIQLTYLEANGTSVEKTFGYLVTTTPAITFFREER
jgi:hypothetical protein